MKDSLLSMVSHCSSPLPYHFAADPSSELGEFELPGLQSDSSPSVTGPKLQLSTPDSCHSESELEGQYPTIADHDTSRLTFGAGVTVRVPKRRSHFEFSDGYQTFKRAKAVSEPDGDELIGDAQQSSRSITEQGLETSMLPPTSPIKHNDKAIEFESAKVVSEPDSDELIGHAPQSSRSITEQGLETTTLPPTSPTKHNDEAMELEPASTCLQPEQQLNDDVLYRLMDLVVQESKGVFGVIDPVTLQAHANPQSLVGSKPPNQRTATQRKEHLLLPFHHRSSSHWSLFYFNKTQGTLIHFDSLSTIVSQQSLEQVEHVLLWLYQMDSIKLDVQHRVVSLHPIHPKLAANLFPGGATKQLI